MYPPVELKDLPPPDLSALEMMTLDGSEYDALKENLSQKIEEAVRTVSYHNAHGKEISSYSVIVVQRYF